MMKYNVEDYTIEVKKNEGENGYYAIILELGCIGDGETQVEALNDVLEVGQEFIDLAVSMGKKLPDPIVTKEANEYSGKFTVRLPKSLHKKLAEEAKKENCSINQLALSYISFGYGEGQVSKANNLAYDSYSRFEFQKNYSNSNQPVLVGVDSFRIAGYSSKKVERCH